MSLEQSIQNLADAINALAATRTAHEAPIPTMALSGAEAPKPRGRPRKVEPAAAAPEEFSAEAPVAVGGVVAKDPEVQATVDVGDGPSQQALRELLINIVKKHGRDACGALCRKHGAANLTALSPDVYPAVYADALELFAKPAQG